MDLRSGRTARPASHRPSSGVRQSARPAAPPMQTTSPPWEQANAHQQNPAAISRTALLQVAELAEKRSYSVLLSDKLTNPRSQAPPAPCSCAAYNMQRAPAAGATIARRLGQYAPPSI